MRTKTCVTCLRELPLDRFSLTSDKRLKTQRPKSECKDCATARAKAWNEANKERAASNAKEYRLRNHAQVLEREAAYRQANLERRRRVIRQWHQENRARSNFHCSKRRAAKLQAVPVWADEDAIQAVYAEAAALRALGLDVHVDHIVPLQAELACGLHVHHNLQILLADDNMAKSNKHTVTA